MTALDALHAEAAALTEQLAALRQANADGRVPHHAVAVAEYLLQQLHRSIARLEADEDETVTRTGDTT
ncbi:MAG: hypothetical protein KY462_12450 [Actinobacteria bacterium]|nr:hypothetical protein [Actinomycetota bacterium]